MSYGVPPGGYGQPFNQIVEAQPEQVVIPVREAKQYKFPAFYSAQQNAPSLH